MGIGDVRGVGQLEAFDEVIHVVPCIYCWLLLLFVVCWFAQIKPSKSEAGRHLSVPFLDLCGAPPPGFTCLLLGGVEETRDGC